MSVKYRRHTLLFCALAASSMLTSRALVADDQAPKTIWEVPMTRKAHDSKLGPQVEAECNQLYHLLLDRKMLMDPKARKERLQEAKPLLVKYQADFKGLVDIDPAMEKDYKVIETETTQRLALLGDEETNKSLQIAAASEDPAQSIPANCILLGNSWTMADGDRHTQGAIADSLEKLDKAHPESEPLTALTFKFANDDVPSEMHERLLDMAIAMDNPSSKKLDKLRQIRLAATKTAAMVGHPFVLTGKTADGKDFTTADLKGKVILIDFWATWCGPCKAELPNVQKLYADLHDKGFEVVGISNDFDLDVLAKFTTEKQMPWPQLVDADAAKRHTWNQTTLNNGIDGIPRMFVIDRNGVLLSVDAKTTYKKLVEDALAPK